jgi:tetratricopeptide (TPR) repeat protein
LSKKAPLNRKTIFTPRRLALVSALLPLFLGACASVPSADLSREPGAQAPQEARMVAAPAGRAETALRNDADGVAPPVTTKPVKPEEPRYGNFSEDVLARAILAELSGQRGDTEQSLAEYAELSRETGDLNVIKRTMRIAVFLRNSEASLEMAKLWLDQESHSREARQTIAIQMIALGRYGDALEHLVVLLEDGHPVNFRLLSGRLAADANGALYRDALIGDFSDLLERFPRNDSLKLALAQLYQQNRQNAEAYAIVSRLAREQNDNPEVVLTEVQLLDTMGDATRSQKRLAEALQKHGDHKQLRFQYGRKLIEQRDFDGAREQFAILVEQDPSDHDIVYSLALLSMEVDQVTDARRYLERLVTNGKRLDDAHYYLGYISVQEGDSEAAIEHYLRVSGGTNFLQAQRNLTELMIDADRYNEANAHLQNLRLRNTDYNIPLLTMEANLLMDADRDDDAAALLDSSINTFPNDIQLLFLRSVLSTERNDLAQMEHDLRKIIALDPSSPVAYNSLGYTLADRTDRVEEAYELIQRAVELSPDDPAVIDSLGWVQYRLGMLAEARQNLTRAYELYPDHEVAAHLGEVLWVLGERSEATRVWRSALQAEPNSAHIRSTVQRLQAGTSI